MIQELIILAVLWAAYFAAHSFLASAAVKQRFANQTTFRLLYSLFSGVGIIGLFFYQATLGARRFFEPTQMSQMLGVGFGFLGFYLARMAFRKTGFRSFLGLKPELTSQLVTDGIYARMRHPLYTATISLGVGFFIFSPSPAMLVMLSMWVVYLPIGIWLEEKKLVQQFGDQYRTYQNEVKAILPHIL